MWCKNTVDMPNDPYGLNELRHKLRFSHDGQRVSCAVRGCPHWLVPPSRSDRKGQPCPVHGIRVHKSHTWGYADDYRRNVLIDADYFHRHIRYNDQKLEGWRYGNEQSEDCLTWCAFRSLQRAGQLHQLVERITGVRLPAEPTLILWGLEILPDGVRPWDLLLKARDRFESDLPHGRPKTEPDVALHAPGVMTLLIEVKFTSSNPSYRRDKAKLLDLTLDQLVQIYQWPGMRLLALEEAHRRDRIHYQLYRNILMADFISQLDSDNTEPYVANLIREGYEADVCEPMLTLMPAAHRHRFEQITWEQVYRLALESGMSRLCDYLRNKTARLKPAFKIPKTP